ncbi:DsbA family protein [Chitinimonas arctica]|uniref:DsbA family protein n=1 Tax=Chitinimonas arctica TaxID=2594795 RepID=A0A516SBG3_9NEIS|nr:DsbA family protein [Chitinimonas arctica]QDQ25484.1 DsbA family protein [Chitinimonas arctica]
MMTLHFIFDPLCGWCYATAPLVAAAGEVAGLRIAFHGGGMMVGDHRRPITPQWRDYVLPHDRRIAQLSGQPFGDAYFEGLLRDTGAVMDSAPPTTAVLACEDIAGRGVAMIHRLQRAHYIEGQRIAEPDVLVRLAVDLGLDAAAFREVYARLSGAATERHFDASRRLLDRVGGRGFPSFALELDDGAFKLLDVGPWLGKPERWKTFLIREGSVRSRS